jgi:flagellar biosynthesis/type III secretory pathway ATPase
MKTSRWNKFVVLFLVMSLVMGITLIPWHVPSALAGDEDQPLIQRAKNLMSTYSDMEELIRLGAYRKGSNPEVDEAIAYHPLLEDFLKQQKDEACSLEEGYEKLAQVLNNLNAGNES